MKSLEEIFFRRPRLLNLLHRICCVNATSQTIEPELRALEKYAGGAKTALEIGAYQGVSAARIAGAMDGECILYCVDPWPARPGQVNACFAIFNRHLRRMGVASRIKALQVTSNEAEGVVPNNLDFIFVDGDHSWSGIETDWRIARQKIRPGGVICLHDSFIPPGEEWRQTDSVRFFQEVIRADPDFELVEQVHSMAVIVKNVDR